MTYQEKLQEHIRELDNIDSITLVELKEKVLLGDTNNYDDDTFLAGIEQGLSMALKLAEDFKVNKNI